MIGEVEEGHKDHAMDIEDAIATRSLEEVRCRRACVGVGDSLQSAREARARPFVVDNHDS